MTTTTRRPRTTAAPSDPFWRDNAACARIDGELFFPIGDNTAARRQAEQAKRICALCPVKQQCLSWALETRQDTGVWGGLSEKERHAIHRRHTGTGWRRPRNVADSILATRLEEYTALEAQGLTAVEIADAMGTNVQTVNRVRERVAAQAAVKEVAAA